MEKFFLLLSCCYFLAIMGCGSTYVYSGYGGRVPRFVQQQGFRGITPPHIGHLTRPMDWRRGPAGIQIVNDRKEHARCWIDIREAQWLAGKRPQRARAIKNGRVQVLPLLAPGQETYHFIQPGTHTVTCEFYTDGAVFHYLKTQRLTFSTVDQETFEYRLNLNRVYKTVKEVM